MCGTRLASLRSRCTDHLIRCSSPPVSPAPITNTTSLMAQFVPVKTADNIMQSSREHNTQPSSSAVSFIVHEESSFNRHSRCKGGKLAEITAVDQLLQVSTGQEQWTSWERNKGSGDACSVRLSLSMYSHTTCSTAECSDVTVPSVDAAVQNQNIYCLIGYKKVHGRSHYHYYNRVAI